MIRRVMNQELFLKDFISSDPTLETVVSKKPPCKITVFFYRFHFFSASFIASLDLVSVVYCNSYLRI